MSTLWCRAIRERRLLRFSDERGARDIERYCRGCSGEAKELGRERRDSRRHRMTTLHCGRP